MVKFSLLKIERLDLLEKLFGKVMIPVAVYEELTADERYEAEAKQLKRATGLDQGESIW